MIEALFMIMFFMALGWASSDIIIAKKRKCPYWCLEEHDGQKIDVCYNESCEKWRSE
jgi:hypothetical protein